MYRRSRSLRPPPAVFGRLPRSTVALLFPFLLLATPSTSQIVTGRVVDASDEPVSDVTIVLLDMLAVAHREVVSTDAGEFFLVAAAPGTYRLQASRRAYATAETRPIEIGDGEVVEVELRVDVEVVELEPLTVVVRRRETQREQDQREFYARVEYYGERAIGSTQLYTRESLEEWDALSLAEFFTVYSRWSPYGSDCTPKAFLDGRRRTLQNLSVLSVANFEGIELYAGSGPTRSRFWDPDGCGVVLVWTRVLQEGGGLGLVEVLALAGAAALLGIFLIF